MSGEASIPHPQVQCAARTAEQRGEGEGGKTQSTVTGTWCTGPRNLHVELHRVHAQDFVAHVTQRVAPGDHAGEGRKLGQLCQLRPPFVLVRQVHVSSKPNHLLPFPARQNRQGSATEHLRLAPWPVAKWQEPSYGNEE